ncbi:tail-anchored protein insertion receptor WRB-like isoform X1 [Stylophora pistillata]|uniref:Guided entry of tail-anchored proteins factor 1 n=2 Tax=Stylophora pistillata TaxID=50429 RepID=A0A2B4SJI3_STYPI|nr:tail-anchored protein insertion receptor WRB-like isoform X1 [Stylophora pistillata]PFX28738.1 Tail-anchored protein insertion receptor WRB [Stylophora pistillata]
MAVSMVLFVFVYVFVMRILYKSSGFLADWLPRLLMSKRQNKSHVKDTITELKNEQIKINAQDEFAQYMRLDRKIKKLTEELSQTVKQRSEKILQIRKILTVIFMGLLGICHITFLMLYRKEPVVLLPVEWFYPLNTILAFPTGIPGAVGLPCWIVTSNKIISTVLF